MVLLDRVITIVNSNYVSIWSRLSKILNVNFLFAAIALVRQITLSAFDAAASLDLRVAEVKKCDPTWG